MEEQQTTGDQQTTEGQQTSEGQQTQQTPESTQAANKAEILGALQQKEGEQTTETQQTGDGQQTQQTQENGEQPTVQDQIAELANDYGLDASSLSHFQDVDSARAAIRFYSDELARSGLEGFPTQAPPQEQTQQQPTQQPPQQKQEGGIDLSAIGLSEDDPAAKAIRALEAKVEDGGKSLKQLSEQWQQQQEQQKKQSAAKLKSDAEDIVSSFESPKYGAKGRRNASQQWATQRLYDLADAVLIGAHRAGKPLPSLKARLKMAAEIDNADSGGATQTATQMGATGQQQPPPANQQALRAGGTPQRPDTPQMKLTDQWSENPELLSAIANK